MSPDNVDRILEKVNVVYTNGAEKKINYAGLSIFFIKFFISNK